MASQLETTWTYLYRDVFHENDFWFTNVVGYVVTQVVFWGVSALFMIPDITGKPQWMQKYKIQPGKNQPVKMSVLRHACKVAVFNNTIVTIPWMFVLTWLQTWRGCSSRPEDIPTLGRAIVDIIGFMVTSEIVFYYSHRLFHWGPLYRNVHKRHHEFTSPMAVAAVYCHPLEHIGANLSAVTLGSVVMGAHTSVSLLWYAAALIQTTRHHSGYHLPFMTSPQFHDFHHLKFNVNYGTFGVLDRLHGTDKMFREYPQFLRHRIFFSLTPISKIYPDKDKAHGKSN